MSSDRTSPPITLADQTKIRLPLVMLLSLLALVATAAVVWSGDHNAVADHASQLATHDSRIRKLEEEQTDIAVMKNDVRWIRSTLEQQQHDRR
jgi:hypothetical protein